MKKVEQENYKPEDIYEPEMANEDDINMKSDNDNNDKINNKKRRRKSRWGDKDTTVPPPTIVINPIPSVNSGKILKFN